MINADIGSKLGTPKTMGILIKKKTLNFGSCAVPKFWEDAPMRAKMCVLGEVTWGNWA